MPFFKNQSTAILGKDGLGKTGPTIYSATRPKQGNQRLKAAGGGNVRVGIWDVKGTTLIELLVTMAIILLLAALILPVLSRAQMRSKEARCLNNFKQIGLAHHSFAHDHDSQFPSQVPANEGGTREHYYAGEILSEDFYVAAVHFHALSNELVTPKILKCPSDPFREIADRFATLTDSNISYFVGLKAVMGDSSSMLSGDRNLDLLAGSYQDSLTSRLRWTGDLHQWRGNLLFADGRAEARNNDQLVSALADNKTIDPLPAITTTEPTPPPSPASPPNSPTQFDSASYAQSKLDEFFNTKGSAKRGASTLSETSTNHFVYIEKDNPLRELGSVAPMSTSPVRSTQPMASSSRSPLVLSNTHPQNAVTQLGDTPTLRAQDVAIVAKSHPGQGVSWWWVVWFLALIILAWLAWWRFNARGPAKPREVEET